MSNIQEIYGELVFDEHTMHERLPRQTYRDLMKTIREGYPINEGMANEIAHAMKEWAIEKGATHFTHWFQPLSGITSEKHDSFVEPLDDGHAIMSFSGKELIQGEPDASSFPSGGLRTTFEARGYTAWDPTSFAFIKDEVLCIPTAFCSYTGEALDQKTPLLRSMRAIDEQANRVLALFGEPKRHVVTTVGAEQEFFLISEKDYVKRLDLMITGRTLFGYAPCKGQELEEHYFGAIRPSVSSFMKDLDDELWKRGVPAKTKHNEVAPAQHELAPLFQNANRAIDQNLLTMEEMLIIASRHGLKCLEHEKPFEHINGSGKHNNWSISADGKNLLDPGDDAMANLRFLVFLACVIEAVDDYQELLRASTASAGNDHRLGANEAPPAIISMFLGDDLTRVVDALIEGQDYSKSERSEMNLGVPVLPRFLKDNTDRNRTSPFAFTGNKFEFRMPGSQQNLSDPNTVLNTTVAKSLKSFADAMEGKKGDKFVSAAYDYIKESLRKHQRIIFNGDGYSEEWPAEAEARGLANHRTTPDALPCLISKKTIDLFAEFNVLDEAELKSRYEVKLDKYNKMLNIEARVMKRLVRRDYLPAINRYAAEIARQIKEIQEILPNADVAALQEKLRALVNGSAKISEILERLHARHYATYDVEDQLERALMNAHEIIPLMEEMREAVDSMEILVAREYWPVPTYNEILFYA